MTAFDGSEDQGNRLQVGLDVGRHRRAAVQPIQELSDEPLVSPLGLLHQLDFLALAFAAVLPRLIGEPLDAAVVHDQGFMFTFGADVFSGPAIEAAGVGLGPLVDGAGPVLECHHHVALGTGVVLAPSGVPGLGVERVAVGAGQVGDDVEMMHRPFDHQGLFHGVAKARAPVTEVAQPAGKAADDVVDGAGPP